MLGSSDVPGAVRTTAVQTVVRHGDAISPSRTDQLPTGAMVSRLLIVALVNRLVLGAEATFEADDAQLLRLRRKLR